MSTNSPSYPSPTDKLVVSLRSPNLPQIPRTLSVPVGALISDLKTLACPTLEAKTLRVIFQGKLLADHTTLLTHLVLVEESERVLHLVLKPNVTLSPTPSPAQINTPPPREEVAPTRTETTPTREETSFSAQSPVQPRTPVFPIASASIRSRLQASSPASSSSVTPLTTSSAPSHPRSVTSSGKRVMLNNMTIDELLVQYPMYEYVRINGKPYLALKAESVPPPPPSTATARGTPPPLGPDDQPQVQGRRRGFLDAFFNLGDVLQAAIIFFALSSGASWPKLLLIHLVACVIFMYRTGRLRLDIHFHRRFMPAQTEINGTPSDDDMTRPPQPTPPVWRQALTGFFTSLLPGQGDGFDPAVAAAMAAEDAAVAAAADDAADNRIF